MVVIIIIDLIGSLFAIVVDSLSTELMKMSYINIFDDWLDEEVVHWHVQQLTL